MRRLGILVRVVGLFLFIGFFSSQVDFVLVVKTLTRPGVGAWIAAAALLYMLGHLGNGLGWRSILRSAGVDVSLEQMFLHDLSSVFWSTVLPGGVAGEVVKGVRLAGEGADGGTVAVGLVVSRLVGGGVSCLLALAMLPFTSFVPGLRHAVALALAFVLIGALCVLLVIRLGPRVLNTHLPSLAARIPIGRFPARAAIARRALWGLLTHGVFSVVYALCFGAAGQALTFPDGAALSTLSSVAQLAPISFGGFGIRELTVSQIGGVLVPPTTAAAAAVMLSVLWTSVVLLGGVVELYRVRVGARLAEPGTGR
ncbi:MAG: lysylphosphatidylglycerol synthase transmembrane domain-containing protein [Pseudomonadota bacterium]|nr:lysylphosphatidylglycerol synthase transmembrane domain-containing protein [Pseudomonadota bacterium]